MTFNQAAIKGSDEDFEIEPLDGDASDRSYYRLNFKGANTIPKSVVLMKLKEPFKAETNDFVKLHGFLKECGVPVPEIYLMNPKKGFIYLEDCGNELLAHRLGSMKGDGLLELYSKAIDLLLLLQLEGTRKMDGSNPASSRKFDASKYMEELKHTTTHFIKGFREKNVSSKEEQKLENIYRKIIAPLENEPMVFTHRDYHSRNIMLKNERLLVIDFQDARMGPFQYDLASLLFDSYFELEEKSRGKLLGYYMERLNLQRKKRIDSEKFIRIFYRSSLQRNLKALGTFGYQAAVKKNSFYLQFVPATIGYIRENISRFDELKQDAEWVVSFLTD